MTPEPRSNPHLVADATVEGKLTYQFLLGLPEDGMRHEILDGEHHVNASPVPRHQRVIANLHLALQEFVQRRNLGRVWLSPIDVVLSDTEVVVPDLVYVSRERAHLVGKRAIEGAPDLVVEVISPTTSHVDRGVKRRIYEARGVVEYWLIDPSLETVEILRRPPTAAAETAVPETAPFETAADLTAADHLDTPLLPGFRLRVADLFD